MKRNVLVLGSTGSIGRSTLEVIRMHRSRFNVVGLSANANIELLMKQAKEFNVDMIAVSSPKGTVDKHEGIITGQNAQVELIRHTKPDIVLNGISGSAGFLPSLETVRMGITLAIANKESMVIGGRFIKEEAAKNDVQIIPVDSEHSAIFQCLRGEASNSVKRLILTASGGPFRDMPKEKLGGVTPEMALRHPTWSMGKRITIDSATMMNKGLEIIEASWLFDMDVKDIDVWIHPQSIIHSMVEFEDTSIKAQMGFPDMKIPISYALGWPFRLPTDLPSLEVSNVPAIEFFPPDPDRFPALGLARQAAAKPQLACIMNAADEVAVDAFLRRRIHFDQIIEIVEASMEGLYNEEIHSPEDIVMLDKKTREYTRKLIK